MFQKTQIQILNEYFQLINIFETTDSQCELGGPKF